MRGGLEAIILTELKMFRNRIRIMTSLDYVKMIFLGGAGALFFGAELWFFNRVFQAIRHQEDFSLFFSLHLIERLLAMVFLSSLSMLFFSNIVTALSAVYLSSDMPLLLASPLKPLSIFASKLFETMWNSSLMILVFTSPILISYGYAFDASIMYYLLIVFVLVLFLIPPAGIGVTITMVLVRFFQARRTHQVLTFAGLIFAVTLIVVIRLLKPERLINPADTDDLTALLQSFTLPTWEFVPSTWAMKAAVAAMASNWAVYWKNIGLLALLGAASVGLALFTAHKLFVSGWMRSKESRHSASRARTGRLEPLLRTVLRKATPQSKAMITKDILVFLREPSQWSQLFLLVALVVIYLFNIQFLPKNPLYITSTITVRDLLSWMNLGLAAFVLSAVALRFLFPSVSQEGLAFWTIGSSPVQYRRFLWNKFLLYGIPLFLLAELLTFFSNLLLVVNVYIMILSLGSVFFISFALTGLSIGLGAMYPRFRLQNPARIAMSSGGILFMILSFIYIGAVLAMEASPIYHFFLWKAFGREIPVQFDALCLFGVCIVSLLFGLIPMILGQKALKRVVF